MKKISFIVISLTAALFCLSCVDEQKAGTENTSKKLPVVMTAQVEEAVSRMNMESTVFSWEESDKVNLRWDGQTYSSNTECELLTAVQGGKTVRFEGEFSVYKEDADLCAYYSADGVFLSKTSMAFRKEVSAEQKGNLAAISENLLFYSWIKKADIALQKEGTEISGMDISTKFSPFFAVLKLNVPSSLGYTALKMEASSAVAGHVQIQPQKEWGTLGSNGFAYRPTGTGMVQSTSIEISDNGNVIGDNVYIVVLPDTFDEQAGNYCCSSKTMKFTLKGPSGDVSFEKETDGKIYNGTLTDLGSVPGSMQPLESAELYLLSDEQLKVSVADTVDYTEYYYEIGTAESDCKTPTISSQKFYAKHGFEVPAYNSCSSHYIKVLIRKTLPYISETIAKGYLRQWTFGKDSPVADAMSRNMSLFPKTGDTFEAGGMSIYRGSDQSLGVTLNEDHMVLKTCYVPINAVVQNNADAWLYFKVDRNYSRGYKLFNDNAYYGTASINGNDVTASVSKDSNDPFAQESFVWKLGAVSKGHMYGVRGDGSHAYYEMAFLETGDEVESPVKTSVDVALKVQDCCDVPAVVLDSVKVSESISRGAEYYFIAGTEGFDALADPSPSDARLTASGITIPVQNKSDRMYIKVLGRCEGCDDVYLKAILRNWKFDINYICPQTLVTDYDGLALTLTSDFSDSMCTDGRIGYLGVRKGNAEIIPELSGSGWINANFFAGSFGTIFRILYGEKQIYDIDMPAKVYYSDNDIMKSVRIDDLSKENSIICEWSYNIWLRNFIFLEQASYVPAQYGGDVSIEDFDGNINYN